MAHSSCYLTSTNSKELKDQTLHVRIAGVDAPEAAHFGRPAQPYSEEALQWLRDRVSGRPVYCQLLRRDQYSRIVAVVKVPSRFGIRKGSNLSLEMLRSGWVTIYEQSNAEYGPEGKEAFLAAEAEAKNARRGIWQAKSKLETPAEYKRKHAQAARQAIGAAPDLEKQSADEVQRGWFSRLFGR
ncbi:hypothetical protein HGRIS_007041 [Hohenbuehelia grisea]|uniref:TNase-like domain-containing protein n=1 Tax=Hohenbuehelia grisea TaxID=104357 RepID=A0ABR3JAU3_9AGAR